MFHHACDDVHHQPLRAVERRQDTDAELAAVLNVASCAFHRRTKGHSIQCRCRYCEAWNNACRA